MLKRWRFSLGLASSSFSDTSSTASRGSSGSSFGLSPVWGPSLEHAFSMDFHIKEAQAKFKAVSCPELPLAAWISHLDNPLEMGLWWVEAQRYYWQSQGATPNHLMYKKVQYKCSCPQGLLVLLRALAKPASSSGICRSPFHKSTCGSCSRVVTIEAWTPWPRSLS